MPRRITLMLLVLSGVAACNPATPPTMTAPPDRAELANATLTGILNDPVRLENGRWQQTDVQGTDAARTTVGIQSDLYLAADLNGDGALEAVTLVWLDGGGSGTFEYLAVFGRDRDGAVKNLGNARLGDRVQVRRATVSDKTVVLETIEAGENDALCCPSEKFQRLFRFSGGRWLEVAVAEQGRFSINELSEDTWELLRIDTGEAVPPGLDINLMFDGMRIMGSSGCNRYAGAIREGLTPGDLRLAAPLAVTRMACQSPADEWESRYLTALQSLNRYSFVAGQLVLGYRTDGQAGSLVFRRRDAGNTELRSGSQPGAVGNPGMQP